MWRKLLSQFCSVERQNHLVPFNTQMKTALLTSFKPLLESCCAPRLVPLWFIIVSGVFIYMDY